MKVPGSLWNVRYFLKSFVDYVGAAINVLKENKLEIENNFFILDKTDVRLDKTALFAAKKIQS